MLAYEQPVKPTIANANGKAFVAIRGLFVQLLSAGRSEQELSRAVTVGIDVWSIAGINTALAKQRGGTGRQAEQERRKRALMDEIRAEEKQ